ncbi:hypothetical protein [Paenibacillus chitinolyticus]|uniref:hypothetical protein n=1 Tax=Paenibacillus chitinolyticus TaxID=79263 RepID=UPI00364E463F
MAIAPENFGEHLARLNMESRQFRADIEELKRCEQKNEADIRQLYAGQARTETLVGQVLTRFDGFETRMFNVFQQMTRDNAELLQQVTRDGSSERLEGQKERTNAQQAWISFSKYVIAVTIAAVIAYIFSFFPF